MKNPLVSVIVTTRNNHETLEACLASIHAQTYSPLELIVVDNSSHDDTATIARRYTDTIFTKGPERSAQRNYGASKAHGTFLLFIDSDMELDARVVGACADAARKDRAREAFIVPEESFGVGFWAQCKRLERSFYVGQDTIEAARFYSAHIFKKAGGYSPEMTGGEDWDLSRRVGTMTAIGRVAPFIRHNEGRIYFGKTTRKMYYYAKHAAEYFAKNPTKSALTDKSGPLARYTLFFSRPGVLFKNPFVGVGMLLLKTAEYASGGVGYLQAKRAQAAKEEP